VKACIFGGVVPCILKIGLTCKGVGDFKLRLPYLSPPVIELEAPQLLRTYSEAGEEPAPDDGTANLNPLHLLYTSSLY
jgi:hypothetical protein